ncbi:hypothetical protein ACFL6U_23385 [Planctomycetota bacterium]
MNQLELNHIAHAAILQQSLDVAKSLRSILIEDLDQRAQDMPGRAVHLIHNMALFHALTGINFPCHSDADKGVLNEYIEHTKILLPQFLDIVESLKDFESSGTTDSEISPSQE